MNELRDYGDKKTVVLFTDENKVTAALKNLDRVFKTIPYEQWQEKKIVLVGYDFYMDKRYKNWLVKRIRGLSGELVFHA